MKLAYIALLVQVFGLAAAELNSTDRVVPEPRAGCTYRHTFSELGQSAFLRSPNWPNQYPNNADCSYSLSSPAGTQIRMDCTEVNIEYVNGCEYDRMTISLTGDSTLRDGKKVCGEGSFTRTTTGNALHVGFKSDGSNPSSRSIFRFQCTLTVIGQAKPVTTTQAPARPGNNGQFANDRCVCGERNVGTRIVGGVNADVNEFPWRVAMYSQNLGVFCGGTIISENWVMTAAHCTRPAKGLALYANVGDHDITIAGEANNQYIRCSRVVEHPQYNNETQDNDIALCKLAEPLEFNRKIQPVCLPWYMAGESFQGKTVTASGWGTTSSGGRASNTLKKVDLPVLTTEECRRYYGDAITDNMICTYQPGKDTCQGDSGGSIDYRDPDSRRYFGIGVVSWGVGCAGRNQPGVYAKVTRYLNWIQANTESEQFCR